MAVLVALMAVLFLTCQANTVNEPVSTDGGALQTETVPPETWEEPVQVETAVETEQTRYSKADGTFADNAFPQPLSDVEYHKDSWFIMDCMRCHETGVEGAPVVRHKEMPDILLTAKCRTCHVLIPGMAPIEIKETEDDLFYTADAFPPMIPASISHQEAWYKDDCLLCHETGVRGATVVKHKDMPKVLLKAKCRSCHVQVRSSSIPGR